MRRSSRDERSPAGAGGETGGPPEHPGARRSASGESNSSGPAEGDNRGSNVGADPTLANLDGCRSVLPWVAWIGASALLTELYFIRIFDAIVGPSAAYGLVGLALFGISLAGVTTAIWPSLSRPTPLRIALALAASPIFTWTILRYVPFSIARIPEDPLGQTISFALLGLALIAPFFLSALAVIQLLASGSVRRIYAADLAGSALGPWLLPGLLPLAGPAGVLLSLFGGQLLGAAFWVSGRQGSGSDSSGRSGVSGPTRSDSDTTSRGDSIWSGWSSRPSAAASTRTEGGPRMLLRTGTRTRLHASHRTSLRWPATRFTPRLASLGLAVLGLAAIAFALSGGVADWDVPSHAEKRGAKETQLRAHAEFRRWDPVSKIEVVDLTEIQPSTGEVVPGTGRKLISYDGGAQSSHIYAFDGDLAELRAHLDEHILDHFWQRGVAAAHWFARDQGARVFVAGCAGGQEVTAALLFGASEVVAVDLVGTVVELGTETYVDYNGGIFLDPRVQFYQAEARTELARREEPFDIIEIFSYHNSSRVAAGSLALKAFYLHTAETYGLCLERLSENGVLQIHQGFFPRVVTTLAEAWRRLGWDHLEQHVLIYGRDGIEDHYTILVKRSPWTAAEVEEVDRFLLADFPSEGREYSRIEDPTDRTQSFLPDAFYQAPLPDSIRARAAFRVDPVTDDNPFSLYLRKGFGSTAADPKRFATRSEAALLDELVPTRIPLPRDIAHLVLLGVAGLLLSLLAFGTTIFLARRPSGAPVCSPGNPARPTSSVTSSTPSTSVAAAHAARSHEVQPRPALASSVYFYLVGLGFIGIEWTLVQFAMRLIALPIQAFGAALGVVLVGAALGSWSSERLRARWVFPAIVLLGGGLLLVFPAIVPQLRTAPLALRVLAFAVAALPLTFCLGFPFPSALAALRNPREIASAWALNGAASVTGSVFVAALFASIGVGATGALGLLVYVGAGLLHGRVLDRRDPTSGPGPRAA